MDQLTLKQKIDCFLFRRIVEVFYPQYYRPKYGYRTYFKTLKVYFFYQKILRVNGGVKWPVHRTSLVLSPEKIKKGYMCDPGDNLGNYIQASNGIEFGNNVELGPGVKIISSNHEFEDFSKIKKSVPIKIGSNVWIGANSVVLPGVSIGDNVIIGAGSIVTKNIPSNSISIGNPSRVVKENKDHIDTSIIILNKKYNV